MKVDFFDSVKDDRFEGNSLGNMAIALVRFTGVKVSWIPGHTFHRGA